MQESHTQHTQDTQQSERPTLMHFTQADFAKLIMNDLRTTRVGRGVLKKYKQSEVREIVENYTTEVNQKRLREISRLLYAKSTQYKRLIGHFAQMPLMAYVLTPVKDIRKANKNKVIKQYAEIAEKMKSMNLRHEMLKVLTVAFREDTFYGYIHVDKKSFYIQSIDADICKITSVEDGIYNYSIDMSYFEGNESALSAYAKEITLEYNKWKRNKSRDKNVSKWVELPSKDTICIKVNEDMQESFPPFAGIFDSIYDIEGFKQLRKDKEELGNYMILTQELPMRKDSGDNNDFMLDHDTVMLFHNRAADSVPDNVAVITSPMKIEPIKFDKDRADSDGVGKATRDMFGESGVSQLLFSSDSSTSQGLLMSIKTDEELVFSVTKQIERWINRLLKTEYNDLMFNVDILNLTQFNKKDVFDMYIQAATYGVPIKSHICAIVELEPIEMLSMATLENEILELHDKFIPLQSSHTQSASDSGDTGGRPTQGDNISDETARAQDKPSANTSQ